MNLEWRELRQIGFGYENVTSNLVQKVDFELLVFEIRPIMGPSPNLTR